MHLSYPLINLILRYIEVVRLGNLLRQPLQLLMLMNQIFLLRYFDAIHIQFQNQ